MIRWRRNVNVDDWIKDEMIINECSSDIVLGDGIVVEYITVLRDDERIRTSSVSEDI